MINKNENGATIEGILDVYSDKYPEDSHIQIREPERGNQLTDLIELLDSFHNQQVRITVEVIDPNLQESLDRFEASEHDNEFLRRQEDRDDYQSMGHSKF